MVPFVLWFLRPFIFLVAPVRRQAGLSASGGASAALCNLWLLFFSIHHFQHQIQAKSPLPAEFHRRDFSLPGQPVNRHLADAHNLGQLSGREDGGNRKTRLSRSADRLPFNS